MLAVAIIWPPGRQANLNGPPPRTSGPSLKSLRCLCLRRQGRREHATRRSSSDAGGLAALGALGAPGALGALGHTAI